MDFYWGELNKIFLLELVRAECSRDLHFISRWRLSLWFFPMMFEAEQEYSPPFSLWIFWMTTSPSVSYCGLFAIYYLDGQAVTGNYNSFVFVLEHFAILRVAKKDRKKSAKYEKYLLKNDNQLTLWCQVIDRYGGLLLILKYKVFYFK